MIFYHFTSHGHLPAIIREGLTRGDVPTRSLDPANYGQDEWAVWLTTDPNPVGHGLEHPNGVQAIGDKKAVRIEVSIPTTNRKLKRWATWGRSHCKPQVFDTLTRANGSGFKSWWLYFGVIKPEDFREVKILKKLDPITTSDQLHEYSEALLYSTLLSDEQVTR